MQETLQTFDWRFGGPLSALPSQIAWGVLALIAVIGLAVIVVSYRRTLVALSPARRATLMCLRLLVWAGLMLALAGPTRVERTYTRPPVRPIAVVVDRSDSMTTPDNRGNRRIDDALRRWKPMAADATTTLGQPRLFAFANQVDEVGTLDASAPGDSRATRLFASLDEVLAKAPSGGWGGVVLITDGLDTQTQGTTARAAAETTRAALAAGTPLYPIVGHNRYAGGDFIALRDMTLPARVPPRSDFTLELSLDTYQTIARSVPVRLRVGDQWIKQARPLDLSAGRRASSWSITLNARNEGTLPVELVIGEEPDSTVVHAEVQVATPATTRILYYQGSLDWGYRFLADILRRDPAFRLTPIFNIGRSNARNRAPSGSLVDLPGTLAELNDYDVIVLANAAAHQISTEKQALLDRWVSDGGVLVFLAPDNTASQAYAGSPLESILPVVFGDNTAAAPVDTVQNDFRTRMRELGGARGSVEYPFAANTHAKARYPGLHAFQWEPAAAGIFGPGREMLAPLFVEYSTILRAKPGATVLARHPAARSPDGREQAILLALQRYGRGQSAVFTSDALWRWKLSQPSDERHVETFWQNLFAWLGREKVRGPRFQHAPFITQAGSTIDLKVLGLTGQKTPLVIESLIDGSRRTLMSAGESDGAALFRWQPEGLGEWLVTATDGDGLTARHWLRVVPDIRNAENSGLPPDMGLLQTLARGTGGETLGTRAPASWSTAPASHLIGEKREPLWHAAWLLLTLLGLYAIELVMRRRWKLL